jgi:tetratricopeptide (TPR) repeat protein
MMSWVLKGGKPLCLESMILARVEVGGRDPQKHEAAPLKEDLDRLTREVERLKGEADERRIGDLANVVEVKPRHAPAYYDLGNAYRQKGQFDAAIANYTKALEINTAYADAYHARGLAYASKGDFKRATDDYYKAKFLRGGGDASVLSDSAWAYFKYGQAERGLSDANRSLELRPGHAPTLSTRGAILEALGRRQEAIADFRRALAIDPTHQGGRDALKRLGVSP